MKITIGKSSDWGFYKKKEGWEDNLERRLYLSKLKEKIRELKKDEIKQIKQFIEEELL